MSDMDEAIITAAWDMAAHAVALYLDALPVTHRPNGTSESYQHAAHREALLSALDPGVMTWSEVISQGCLEVQGSLNDDDLRAALIRLQVLAMRWQADLDQPKEESEEGGN